MIIMILLGLLIVVQALLTTLSVIARLLWGFLGLALVYFMIIQLVGS